MNIHLDSLFKKENRPSKNKERLKTIQFNHQNYHSFYKIYFYAHERLGRGWTNFESFFLRFRPGQFSSRAFLQGEGEYGDWQARKPQPSPVRKSETNKQRRRRPLLIKLRPSADKAKLMSIPGDTSLSPWHSQRPFMPTAKVLLEHDDPRSLPAERPWRGRREVYLKGQTAPKASKALRS